MRNFVQIVGLLFMGHAAFGAQNLLPLAGVGREWQARAAHEMPIQLEIKEEILQVDAAPDGGEESFPHLNLPISPAEDWRNYHTLAMEVRLSSENPDILANGKELAFCLYDSGLRHTALDGNPPVQQLFARAKVHAGEWQPIEVDLTGATRGAVTGMDIHLYELPYSYAHQYRFEFRNLQLRGTGEDAVVFDGNEFPVDGLQKQLTVQKSAGTVRTDDGFALEIGESGSIVGVREGDRQWVAAPKSMTGIWLFDAAQENAIPQPLGGTLEVAADGSMEQRAELPELGIAAEVRYLPEGDFIRVQGSIKNLRPGDRAISVYWALPLAPEVDYDFYTSLLRSVKPFDAVKQVRQFEAKVTQYPFTVAASPEANQAIAIAVDQGKPVNYRLGVHPGLGILYAAADFGLVDELDVAGNSLQETPFEFLVYAADPAWGMRSAADRYYRHFPEYYVDRTGAGGGWEIPWYRKQSGQKRAEILAGGYRFVWGAEELAPEEWQWNAENGSFNLIYIEPEFFQFSMGDFQSPTSAETLERMRKLSDQEESEWEKFLPLHYSTAYNCNPHAENADRRDFLHGMIEAAFHSGMYDAKGEAVLGLGNRVAWIGDSGFGAMVPCNMAPAIPHGRGQAAFDQSLQPLIDQFAERNLATPKGFGLDCFMDVPPDFRRENFRYMTLPLSFDAKTKLPVVARGFGSIEWLRELVRRYRPEGMVVMANAFGPITFAAPDLDIFGIENTFVTDPEFLRTIAGPYKPTTYLPYEPQEKKKIEYHLFWGIYPGRNVTVDILAPMIPVLDKLFAASWQPVSHARANAGAMLERFGADRGSEQFFTLHNPAAESKVIRIDFDLPSLGIQDEAWKIMQIYPEEQTLQAQGASVDVPLEAGATAVLLLKK